MASLPQNPSTLLLADCGTGVLYSLNTKISEYRVAIDGEEVLEPAPNAPVDIGVNGLQPQPHEPGTLYWTNFFKDRHFGRTAIDPKTGYKAGRAEVLFTRQQEGAQDDFSFDADGNAWLAGSPASTVVQSTQPGWDFEVAVNDTAFVAGPTACKCGPTRWDAETLYIVTNGGLPDALPQGIRDGAVVAVDRAGL